MVSVNAYGILDTVTFPLACRLYKPQRRCRLKPGDRYKSKPQLAIELIQELAAQGFHFSVVLADSLYGESGEFVASRHCTRWGCAPLSLFAPTMASGGFLAHAFGAPPTGGRSSGSAPMERASSATSARSSSGSATPPLF